MDKIITINKYFTDINGGTKLYTNTKTIKPKESKAYFIEKKHISNYISDKNIFIAAFTYCLHCFTGEKDCIFSVISSDLDKVKYLPYRIFCGFDSNKSFLKKHKDFCDLLKSADNNELFQIYKKQNLENAAAIYIERNNSFDTSALLENNPSFVLKISFTNSLINIKIIATRDYPDKILDNFIKAYKKFLIAFWENIEINSIDYISKEELKCLDKNNHSEVKLHYSDVIEAFNYQVENNPNNWCVCYKELKYTYGQSSIIIKQIQNLLKENNVTDKSYISIFVPRSIWFLLAPIAILSLGATYVPIDITYPEERINHMLKDTKSSLILVCDESIKICHELSNKINNFPKILNLSKLDTINISDKNLFSAIEYRAAGKNDTACIVYTSGSTGVPKGSIITRLAIINLSEWYIKRTKMSSVDVYGMYSSFVFDMHAMALWPTCVCGALLDIIPEEKRINIASLNEYFTEHNVTHTFLTTQVAKMYAQTIEDSNLKVLFAAGEALRNVKKIGNYKMYDGYGPCENLALSTSINVNNRINITSVGFVNSNVKAYVLDSNYHRVPYGAIGELYLSGFQVAKGYLNRNKETKDSFLSNKFDGNIEGYETMYKTGDIVNWLDDWSIGFVGRNDNQVKIRGNRVELSEIEDTLKKSPYISDVTVQVLKKGLNNDIVAYVVLNSTANDNKTFLDSKSLFDYIIKFVEERKPSYMVPGYVVEIDKIPLNINSKVDKNALPKPNINLQQKDYVAPRDKVEKDFVDAFEHVLNIEKISIDDNFFDLGGSSILAMQLYGYDIFTENNILLQNIVDNPTPRLLAQFLNNKKQKLCDILSNGIYDYDYSLINSYLKLNVEKSKKQLNLSLDTYKNISENVIITGVTGFLGIHVLKEFLDCSNATVYCLIRSNSDNDANSRLNLQFHNYFNTTLNDEQKNRIFVVEGDLTNDDTYNRIKKIDAKIIINCAACISYYKKYEYMYKNNVEVVDNLIDVCIKSNKKLIQISTISVYGSGNNSIMDYAMKEDTLYFQQKFEDSYDNTKFIAERKILQAIVDRGLNAKIIRLGNLTGRFEDGVFKKNTWDNAFILAFWAFSILGSIPNQEYLNDIEFSPIDNVAKAIVKICHIKNDLTIWHVFNDKTVLVKNIVEVLNEIGIKINNTSKEETVKIYKDLCNSNFKNINLMHIILYPLFSDDYNVFENNHLDCKLSSDILKQNGFCFSNIDKKYLKLLFIYLKQNDYF